MQTMDAAIPISTDPVLAAIARAPLGEPFTPEQRAELDQDRADIAAGRMRLVPHDDVPAALEQLYHHEHGGG